MTMKYVLLITLMLSWFAQAADENTTVYSWTDAQGVTHFSDKPINEKNIISKKVEIINPPVSNPNPVSENTDSTPAAEPAIAYTLQIASPQNEQTFRDNSGQITVQNQLSPALPDGESAQLVLYVDGSRYACNSSSLSCEATNIARGTHQLRTELIAQNGKILASSNSVTVYLFRVTAIK
jgi:hypothetical protein